MNSFNNNILLYSISLMIFFMGCDSLIKDSPQGSEEPDRKNNTIDAELGIENRLLSDYFYDFNNEIDAHFVYYSEPYYPGMASSVAIPVLLDEYRDTLNFKTFPDFLLDLTPDSLEYRSKLFILNEADPDQEDWCSKVLIGDQCDLESVDFNNCLKITDISITTLAKNCLELTTINIAYCPQITDVSIIELAHHCPKLNSIFLCKCNITDVSVIELAKNCPELMIIDLKKCFKITNISFTTLLKHSIKLLIPPDNF